MEDLELLKLASDLKKLEDNLKAKQPYHVNLIDELHADENAHTRILAAILRYKTELGYSNLKSFVELEAEKCPELNNIIEEINHPKIETQTNYIDCLIKEDSKYAIIIENKINWAIDQKEQIKRYIMTVMGQGLKKDNIFLIYLTDTGAKHPESNSFTTDAKKLLDFDTKNTRFIESNYRDDVLRWLKESILPNVKYKDDLFLSLLKQYIDYLNGRFGLRKTQKEQMTMNLELENRFGLTGKTTKEKISKLFEIHSQTANLLNTINNYKNDILQKELFDDFVKIIENHFGVVNNQIKDFKSGYLQMFDKSWSTIKSVYIHFEWNPLTVATLLEDKNYTLRFDVEGKNREQYRKRIKENCDTDFKRLEFSEVSSNPWAMYQKTFKFTKSYIDMSSNEREKEFSRIYDELKPLKEKINSLLANKAD